MAITLPPFVGTPNTGPVFAPANATLALVPPAPQTYVEILECLGIAAKGGSRLLGGAAGLVPLVGEGLTWANKRHNADQFLRQAGYSRGQVEKIIDTYVEPQDRGQMKSELTDFVLSVGYNNPENAGAILRGAVKLLTPQGQWDPFTLGQAAANTTGSPLYEPDLRNVPRLPGVSYASGTKRPAPQPATTRPATQPAPQTATTSTLTLGGKAFTLSRQLGQPVPWSVRLPDGRGFSLPDVAAQRGATAKQQARERVRAVEVVKRAFAADAIPGISPPSTPLTLGGRLYEINGADGAYALAGKGIKSPIPIPARTLSEASDIATTAWLTGKLPTRPEAAPLTLEAASGRRTRIVGGPGKGPFGFVAPGGGMVRIVKEGNSDPASRQEAAEIVKSGFQRGDLAKYGLAPSAAGKPDSTPAIQPQKVLLDNVPGKAHPQPVVAKKYPIELPDVKDPEKHRVETEKGLAAWKQYNHLLNQGMTADAEALLDGLSPVARMAFDREAGKLAVPGGSSGGYRAPAGVSTQRGNELLHGIPKTPEAASLIAYQIFCTWTLKDVAAIEAVLPPALRDSAEVKEALHTQRKTLLEQNLSATRRAGPFALPWTSVSGHPRNAIRILSQEAATALSATQPTSPVLVLSPDLEGVPRFPAVKGRQILDVWVHGEKTGRFLSVDASGKSSTLINTSWAAATVLNELKKLPPDTIVRLNVCGAGDSGGAQAFADLIRRPVLASDGVLFVRVFRHGIATVHPKPLMSGSGDVVKTMGRYVLFKPKEQAPLSSLPPLIIPPAHRGQQALGEPPSREELASGAAALRALLEQRIQQLGVTDPASANAHQLKVALADLHDQFWRLGEESRMSSPRDRVIELSLPNGTVLRLRRVELSKVLDHLRDVLSRLQQAQGKSAN